MFEFFLDNALAIVLGVSLGLVVFGLALTEKKPKYREKFPDLRRPDPYREMAAGVEKIEPRPITKRRELAASYTPPTRKPRVLLSPRQIERVNIVRKQQGREPFNRVGLKSAVSAAWDTPRREPTTTNDWLTYLIMYEIFFADHQAPHCAGAGGVIIDPNQPYNGAGGEFAGAGASGDWTSAPAPVAAIASGIAVGASAAYIASHLEDSNLKPVPVENYTRDWTSAPDPAPSNPPDSPRSASADTGGGGTGSSPVSDSTPSYTSSSDSSSSGGGGDSGGGGGGGGGGGD